MSNSLGLTDLLEVSGNCRGPWTIKWRSINWRILYILSDWYTYHSSWLYFEKNKIENNSFFKELAYTIAFPGSSKIKNLMLYSYSLNKIFRAVMLEWLTVCFKTLSFPSSEKHVNLFTLWIAVLSTFLSQVYVCCSTYVCRKKYKDRKTNFDSTNVWVILVNRQYSLFCSLLFWEVRLKWEFSFSP